MNEQAIAMIEQGLALLRGAMPAPTTHNKTLAPAGSANAPTWLPSGKPLVAEQDIFATAADDFFVEGRLSAQKGALAGHYAQAFVLLAMVGGDCPHHLQVVTPAAADAPWSAAMKQAADPELLWVGDGTYRPDATLSVQQNYARFQAAGYPTKNVYGQRFDQRGQIVDPKDWDHVFGILGKP